MLNIYLHIVVDALRSDLFQAHELKANNSNGLRSATYPNKPAKSTGKDIHGRTRSPPVFRLSTETFGHDPPLETRPLPPHGQSLRIIYLFAYFLEIRQNASREKE